MSRDFGSMSAAVNQLKATQQAINSFKDEVAGDDLPRYSNVDSHLSQLRDSIEGAQDALISLENLNVAHLPNFDGLMQTVNIAISTLNKKKNMDASGALAAALGALKDLQQSIGEISTQGPSEDDKRRVEKTDTDLDAGE